MTSRILYLGDTSLQGPASYLAGLMADRGWGFDYLASDQAVTVDVLDVARPLVILSDYPAAMMGRAVARRLVDQVRAGAGLLMIGGWESFKGSDGHWDSTPIAEVLPVSIAATDDRQNCDHAVLLESIAEHPITADLPWSERPPLIGGYNRFAVARGATVLIEAQHFMAKRNPEGFHFVVGKRDPMLVVGDGSLEKGGLSSWGAGRTAALAHDVAPHWVGPLVDWGPTRVTAKAPNGDEVEVGNLYARFFQQLLEWVGRL